MSELSNELGVPYDSGLTIDGVPIPLAVEAADGTREERVAAVEQFIADYHAQGAPVAFARATARLAGEDPDAAGAVVAAAQSPPA